MLPNATKFSEPKLGLEEDRIWDTIAEQRDVQNARYIPHDKAWDN